MIKEYYAKTDQGPHLKINEDNYFFDMTNLTFGACDAFGGSNIGDLALKILLQSLTENFTKFSHDPEATMPFFYNSKFLLEANALINSLHQCHRQLVLSNLNTGLSKRAGVSGIFATLSGDVLTTVSLGNLILIYEQNKKLTVHIPPEVMAPNYFGHDKNTILCDMYPLNALGLHEDLIYYVKELKINPGDKLYILSDGIYPFFELSELEALVKHTDLKKPSDLVSHLLEQANLRGNTDNQTALVVEF
jgi:serine/threonine protein phosphatase PrpC